MSYPHSILSGSFVAVTAACFMQMAVAAEQSQAQQLTFEDTRNGQPLKIVPDSEQAKTFVRTGQNPYIGNAQAIAQGKKLYNLYSCGQCHGHQAQGQTAKGLTGPQFNYAKSATDKGMFEIIHAGTNGGMSPKGKGMMDPNDPNNGLSVDEALKVIAWIRSQGEPAK
jgi:cytochrome c-L